MNEDKLKRLVEDCLLDEDEDEDKDSSSDEWTPENANNPQILPRILTRIDIHTNQSSQAGPSKININKNRPNNQQDETKRVRLDEKTGEILTYSGGDNITIQTEDDILQNENILSNIDLADFEAYKSKRIILNESTGEFYSEEEIENEVENHVVEVIKRGKKRIYRPATWIRNQKIKENKEKHIMREIPNCRCNCKGKISTKEAERVFNKFINFASHTEQNIYLQGCLYQAEPQRFRPVNDPKTARPRRVFKYNVTLKNKTVVLCQQAFLSIHGIKRERLQRKVQNKEKDIRDCRGRQSHSIYGQDILKKVHDFIESIPARESHYSRSSNKHKKYVDSNLSVAALHRKFMESNPGVKMTYGKFNEIFNKDFNISFALPRKDICSTCEKLNVEINFSTMNKETQKANSLKTEKDLHLRKAEVFPTKITKSEAVKQSDKLSLCFDYQKNLPLPVTNVSVEYYSRQLWMHNFGIHNLSENTACMYLYTENYGQKGPNEVITALADYIEHNKLPHHTQLELFCDNCFSQNKNRYIFTFLDQLCANGIFEKVKVSYPIPGHSMIPVDRDFALIERKRVKSEKVYTPGYYVDLIRNSRNTNKFEVVFLEKNLRDEEKSEDRVLKIKDYKKLYEPRIQSSVTGLSACRIVKFKRFDRPQISASMTGHNFKKISLYRVGMGGKITDDLSYSYQSMIPIKPLKLRDIKKLLDYVPIEKRRFFLDIFEAQLSESVQEPEENNSSDEYELLFP